MAECMHRAQRPLATAATAEKRRLFPNPRMSIDASYYFYSLHMRILPAVLQPKVLRPCI